MTDLADRIRNAPNAKAINHMLGDDEVIISSAPRLWTFQVGGQAMGFPETFEDVRSRVAAYVESSEE